MTWCRWPEALALAALAGLVAVIATRGVARRAVGALLALFGAGAGAAVLTTVTAATVLSVAAGKVASPESAALSGTAAGSTTSGVLGQRRARAVSSSAGHAIMTGAPWQAAVIVGALLIFAAGLATALRGQDWPVMSARYDAPGARAAAAAGGAAGQGRAARPVRRGVDVGVAERRRGPDRRRPGRPGRRGNAKVSPRHC